jgi:uncharacterized protein YndB with AHSA1/START domain
MADQNHEPIRVSRRIDAPASEIFQVLVDPSRHTDFDASGMLRGAASDAVVGGVGDVFVMNMHHPRVGDYQMDNSVVG